MTVSIHNPDDRHENLNPVRAERPAGIYSVPVVGKPAQRVRLFFEDMKPTENDSLGVAAGKQVLRYGAVVGGTVVGGAAAAILVL